MTVARSLGEVYDPFGKHMNDPFPLYERARREEPVFFSPVIGAWVVSHYEDVREALRQPEVFSSANALRPTTALFPSAIAELRKGYPVVAHVVNSDGDVHRQLRVPLTRAMSPARVDETEPFIQERADALVDAFSAGGQADLMDRYAVRLPVDVISHLFGFSDEDTELAFQHSHGAGRMLFGGLPEDEQAEGARSYVALQQLCARYVHARRAQPGDDVVSAVVTAHAPGQEPLTPEQESLLVIMVAGVFIAGHVTTMALLGNGLHLMLSDRAQWKLLCERPDLIDNTVEEIARFGSPSHGFLRVTTRPVTLGGTELPKGAEVFLLYASANRDQALAGHPDVFDITRAPTRHLAFAVGLHACVGAGLARRELAVTLRTFARRLPALRLVEDQGIAVRRSIVARGPVALQATW